MSPWAALVFGMRWPDAACQLPHSQPPIANPYLASVPEASIAVKPSHIAPEQKLSSRLMSIDVFRGATIAAMILVNNPGDGPQAYGPLKHAAWNGWTPADLVFPFFLFIVGVAMAFSFSARLKRGQSHRALLVHALWRGAVLF